MAVPTNVIQDDQGFFSRYGKYILWLFIAVQMAGWAWHQYHGGMLNPAQYYKFCAMMMIGQSAAAVECFKKKAWGTLVVQLYFFVFTGYGWWVRWSQMTVSS